LSGHRKLPTESSDDDSRQSLVRILASASCAMLLVVSVSLMLVTRKGADHAENPHSMRGFITLTDLDTDQSCRDVPVKLLDFTAKFSAADGDAFKYWTMLSLLHDIGAYTSSNNSKCKIPLGPEFDAGAAVEGDPERFRLLLQDEGSHIATEDLQFAVGLQWPIRAFQSINRPLSYELILKALASGTDNTPWSMTTSVVGALTIAQLLQEPLRELAQSPHTITVGDVGSGSGFLLAMLALMTPADATVVGMEIKPLQNSLSNFWKTMLFSTKIWSVAKRER